MSELKLNDFDRMLTASTAIANESFDKSTEDITVVIEDQSGSVFYIEDVKYDPDNGSINIQVTL
jgi:hypothetical protein